MKQELLSNLHQLVHIKIQDKQLKTKYTYIPPKSAKWYRKAKPPRIWDGYSTVDLPNEEWLNENHYLLDEQNRIWAKPRMYMWFSDAEKPLDFIANTYDEILSYREKILAKCENIGLVDLLKTMRENA